MLKSERGGKREGAGRKPKPKIEHLPTKGIATTVLASVDEVAYWRSQLRADIPIEQHHEKLNLSERMHVGEMLDKLTNRRDGKPAQGVFVGDTRENAPRLNFDGLLMPNPGNKPKTAGKPN